MTRSLGAGEAATIRPKRPFCDDGAELRKIARPWDKKQGDFSAPVRSQPALRQRETINHLGKTIG
jgi:hypothetical protein